VNAWSSWLLWAKAVKDCGSKLTRSCLLDKASAVTDWDGGGLTATTHPGNASQPATACFLFMRATASGFVYDKEATAPTKDIFNCTPSNSFNLPGYPTS
jgi:hypothetical protein